MGMGETYDAVVKINAPRQLSRCTPSHRTAPDQAIGVLHASDVQPQPNLAMPSFDGRELAYTGPARRGADHAGRRSARGRFAYRCKGDDGALRVDDRRDRSGRKPSRLPIRRGERVHVQMIQRDDDVASHAPARPISSASLQGAGDRCPLSTPSTSRQSRRSTSSSAPTTPGNWFFSLPQHLPPRSRHGARVRIRALSGRGVTSDCR